VTEYELPMRVGTPEDWDGICRLLYGVFHGTADPETVEIQRSITEPERSLVVTDGDQIVAHAAAGRVQEHRPAALAAATAALGWHRALQGIEAF
jgi:hypothetical protein